MTQTELAVAENPCDCLPVCFNRGQSEEEIRRAKCKCKECEKKEEFDNIKAMADREI